MDRTMIFSEQCAKFIAPVSISLCANINQDQNNSYCVCTLGSFSDTEFYKCYQGNSQFHLLFLISNCRGIFNMHKGLLGFCSCLRWLEVWLITPGLGRSILFSFISVHFSWASVAKQIIVQFVKNSIYCYSPAFDLQHGQV